MNKLLESYPLKNNPVFLRRVGHSAMIGKPVAYMKNGTTVVGGEFMPVPWDKALVTYWANRLIWC